MSSATERTTINLWNNDKGYKIYINPASPLPRTYIVTGPPVSSNCLTTIVGWNQIGMKSAETIPVTTAFPDPTAVRIVKNGAGQIYWPQFEINSMGMLLPGQGYRVNMVRSPRICF